MDSALIGLLGAVIGALAAILGSVITHYLQTRSEREKWSRDKKVEAYSSAIRYLWLMGNRRSTITADGLIILDKQAVTEWLNDVSEAQICLTAITFYCSANESEKINAISKRLREVASRLSQTGIEDLNLIELANTAYVELMDSAQREIRR